MAEEQTQGYYTTKAVSELYADQELRQTFMSMYLESPADAGHFLAQKLNIPDEMVKTIVSKSGSDLSEFVGKNICDYLW